MRARNRTVAGIDSEHLLLLKALLMLTVVASAFLATWHYGLLQRVVLGDSTGLSAAITVVFLIAAGHGGLHVLRLSRALNHVGDVEQALAVRDILAAAQTLPEGCITTHIRHLMQKARFAGPRPIDQRLLLESFEADLREGHGFGWFVADLLLTLGLLGTVIGFILMLAPIGSLSADDHAAIKIALASMSDGMAVALYTTLCGLIGGMLLKIEGMLLDGAVDELVRRTTRLTEIHVLPALERTAGHAAA
jgi:hypothetical protein